MPGQSQKQKYGEFRVFTEWRRRGKWAIRSEFIPSLAAWLLMMGRRYEKMIGGMRDKLAVEQIPGLAESIRTLETCTAHLQRLLNALPQHFDDEDWQIAVAEICRLMDIRPSSQPLPEVPEGQFDHMIMDPTDATDASAGNPVVQHGARAGASGAQLTQLDGSARSGEPDAGCLPCTSGRNAGADPEPRTDGGAPGDSGKRARPRDDRKRRRKR